MSTEETASAVDAVTDDVAIRIEPAAESPVTPEDDLRRRFRRWTLIGSIPALIVYAWMVTRGTFDFFRWQRVANFYDVQARSILDGRFSMPEPVLGIESFTADGGQTYNMYQPPLPALFRLPIIAVTDKLDSRLTQTSMMLAAVLTCYVLYRLHWQIREVVRGDRPFTRVEGVAVAVAMFSLVAGSVVLYEASRAWVYHEALAWGMAFAVGAITAELRYLRAPSARNLAWAGWWTTLAVLTRFSIGLGPVVGLLLIGGGTVLGILRARRAHGSSDDITDSPGMLTRLVDRLAWTAPNGDKNLRVLMGVGAALCIPLALYAAVNYAKFGSFFGIPFDGQGFTRVDPGRRRFLALNRENPLSFGDGYFGLHFIPTTVLAYFRPDGISFTSLFPFVDFRPFPGRVFGGVTFDLIDRSSTVTTSQAALFFPTLAAVWAMLRPGKFGRPVLSILRVPAIAALASGLLILPFGYIANRYLGDFFPFLALGGLTGLALWLHRFEHTPRARWVVPTGIGMVVLVAFSFWVNFSLALWFQRDWSPNVSQEVIAGWIGFQQDVNNALGGKPTNVQTGPALPFIGNAGDLFVINNCEALYVNDGMARNAVKQTPWNPVERTRAAGNFLNDITFAPQPKGTREPIVTSGTPDGSGVNYLYLEHLGNGKARFAYDGVKGAGFNLTGQPFNIGYGKRQEFAVIMDQYMRQITVRLGDRIVFETYYDYEGPDTVFGANPYGAGRANVTPTLTAQYTEKPTSAPVCEEIVERSGGSLPYVDERPPNQR